MRSQPLDTLPIWLLFLLTVLFFSGISGKFQWRMLNATVLVIARLAFDKVRTDHPQSPFSTMNQPIQV